MDLISVKEKKQHSSLYVPYSYYACMIPDYIPVVPLHWHNEFEISFISDGTGIFRSGNQSVIARAGDIIIILPNMLHSIYPYDEKRLSYDTILFNQSMIYGTCDDRCYTECLSLFCSPDSFVKLPITVDHPDYEILKNSLQNVMTCAKANNGQMDLFLKSELLHIFWLLISNNDLCHSSHNSALPINSIRPVLEYIRKNFSDDISIKQLAQVSHLSKSYFMNLFRRATGISAIEYVNQIRIQAACKLLNNTDISSAETAFTCGFQNLSNFNRQFRKFTGFSPIEYRKQMRNAPAFQNISDHIT